MRCSPALRLRLNSAVSSPAVDGVGHEAEFDGLLSEDEKLVTVSSLWKFPVSMMTGQGLAGGAHQGGLGHRKDE